MSANQILQDHIPGHPMVGAGNGSEAGSAVIIARLWTVRIACWWRFASTWTWV